MVRRLVTSLAIITLIMVVVSVSCAAPKIEPTIAPEPPIPAHYSTYISEGLFSISYPPDWVPAVSMIEEVSEFVKEWVETKDPDVLFNVECLFLCGVPFEDGYYPNVNVTVNPRSVGYWTLDEILEADDQTCREYLQQYRENSLVKTVIDSKEAAISDWQDYDPDFGTWRYLTSYVIADEFVWLVTCSCESEDFKDYEDTFDSIARSLRILK